MPAKGVLAFSLMLADVRAMAPVAGIPPNMIDPILAKPWATSSQLERWRWPVIPSATWAESSDSIAPSRATVMASGRRLEKEAKERDGKVGVGSMRGIWPNFD